MNLKKILAEMKEKESLLEAENNNLKECLRRQSLEQPRKSSPAFQNIFRPVASPPVARKPIQSDHYNSSRGSSPAFPRPSMFETTAYFQASSKQFGF